MEDEEDAESQVKDVEIEMIVKSGCRATIVKPRALKAKKTKE